MKPDDRAQLTDSSTENRPMRNNAAQQFPYSEWLNAPAYPDAVPVVPSNPPPAQGVLFPGEVG